MDIETVVYISVGTLAGAWLLLATFTVYVWSQNRQLRRQLHEIGSSRFRIQKVKMDSDYAYQNPTIAPGEELSRRGYSMYNGEPDPENGLQSQNSNPVFVEDLQPTNNRQPSHDAPPFLLHSIETNKRKSLSNPIATNTRLARNSSSNHNFIY